MWVFSTVEVFNTMGNIMSTLGGYLEYCGVFSTVGDIMINVGISWVPWGCSILWAYYEYCGVILSTVGDMMMHVGDMMNTVGCTLPWEEKSFVIWVPHSTEHPQVHVQNFGGWQAKSLVFKLPSLPPPLIFSVISDTSCHTPYLFFKNTSCVAPPQIIFANLWRLSPKPSICRKLWFVVTVKRRDIF